MTNSITPSTAKKPDPEPKTLSKEDQKALQDALNSYIQTSLIENYKKTMQRINEEFGVQPEY